MARHVALDQEPRVGRDVLAGDEGALVGYRGKRHTGVVDVDRPGAYAALDFWEPIMADRGPQLILEPDEFYILASREAVTVPPDHAAEMIPYDTLVGEFRVHYAGFFDPGFGHAEHGGEGSRAVLEVRPHEVPFVVAAGNHERYSDSSAMLFDSAAMPSLAAA